MELKFKKMQNPLEEGQKNKRFFYFEEKVVAKKLFNVLAQL
jgi:hypothetical protein